MKLKSVVLSSSSSSSSSSLSYCQELLMRRKSLTTLFTTIFILVFLSLYLSPNTISVSYFRLYQSHIAAAKPNLAIQEQFQQRPLPLPPPPLQPEVTETHIIPAVSVLLPAWEVLVIGSKPMMGLLPCFCVFERGVKTEARLVGKLPATNGSLFSCEFPARTRLRLPFLEPVLTWFPEKVAPPVKGSSPEMMRWNNLVYESISTENDVVLFAKGVNKLQGLDRPPGELSCVFGDFEKNYSNAVRTDVISSAQEVFRCAHPNLNSDDGRPIRVSLEIVQKNFVVPSVAYYKPWRGVKKESSKKLICASTMIYNVSKFLREWVMYYSRIGVDKFILYDNGSDDDLYKVVNELNGEGYDVELVYWIWPKTQEAGFSHSVVHAKDECSWMMYVDIDEFVYSPSWFESSSPSKDMLRSLLPAAKDNNNNNNDSPPVGQVSIRCYEFGPSNQNQHPPGGVMQGYDCRQKVENRHKSIVRLEAVDFSLWNAIHHFRVRERDYKTSVLSLKSAVVNHYKYQAWAEFKTKFRRRVSAYVVDWMVEANLNSQDRAPGLGYQPVEPEGWAQKFCEVKDDGLKLLTLKWFGSQTPAGIRMAWQS